MNKTLKTILSAAAIAAASQAAAQVSFYENEGFDGRAFSTDRQIGNFKSHGFNDRASSVVVVNNRWEVCEDAQFSGRCAVLRPGRYPSLSAMGLNDRVSSVRMVSQNTRVADERYAPLAAPVYDDRRRNNERLYLADVTSVRAVVGTPEQRCWVERQEVPQAQQRGGANIPGAIAGALIGGILGHQVGGGRGQDIATAGGAVAGAAVGANIGRGTSQPVPVMQDVQRCTSGPGQAKPNYWDVTYTFRGLEHRVQMAAAPGRTITVNRQGEPRT